MPPLLFYLLAAITLGFGLLVVLARNPVTSALSLASCFVGLAALFISLDAYFIGTIQVLVYAGALVPSGLLSMLSVVAASLWPPRIFGWVEPSTNVLRLLALLAFAVVYLWSVQVLRRSLFATPREVERTGSAEP